MPSTRMVRIFLAFGAMTLGFTAAIRLPLAEATVLGFSKTFFMTVLEMLVLGEVVRARRWAVLAAGFAGVLVIVRRDPTHGINHYGLASIASAAMVSAVVVLVRKLSQHNRPLIILTYQAVGVDLLMSLPILRFWQTPPLAEAGLLVVIAAVSAAGQSINILALRASETSALAPLDFTRLVFAVALGLAVFGEWPAPRVFLGAGVIMGAALYTVHRDADGTQ